jgi:ribosomal protein S12 methylthiotransferase
MSKKKQIITVGFIALGCPKNVVDSERMLAEITQAGMFIVKEPGSADVVIINTCAFIEPAKKESLNTIREAIDWKKNLKKRVKKVIVAGCLSERIVQVIKETLVSGEPVLYIDKPPGSQGVIHDDRTRLLINPGRWAYLRISEGCSRQCSFCTIPSIRGPFRSKQPQLVLTEALELVSSGIVELNIIAQDTTYYGRDLYIQNGLVSLINQLEKIESLAWIRLMYLYPTGINDELIDTIANSEKVVHYLDIPIQHINDDILKSMHRPDTKNQIQSLIKKLRSAIPDIMLRTTIIVGFPGETDQQFGELLDFIQWAQFDALGCFKYYPEFGTKAAKMPGQVPESIKKQRLDELMLSQQKIAFTKNRNRIGNRITCIVDAIENKKIARGRFYGQAPDIDSICIIKSISTKTNLRLRPGKFIDAKVVDFKGYDLIIEPI